MNELRCRKCQATNPSYARFCRLCGEPVALHSLSNNDNPQHKKAVFLDTKDATSSSEEMLKTLPSKQNYGLASEDQLETLPKRLNSAPQLNVPPPPRNISLILTDNKYRDEYYAQQRWTEEIDAISSLPTGGLKNEQKQLEKKEEEEEDNNILLIPPHFTFNNPRADHKQPSTLRADHKQPSTLRADHKQPSTLRADHRLPVIQRATHKKPLNIFGVVGGAVVLLVGLVVLLSQTVLRSNAQQPAAPKLAQLAALNARNAFPGGVVMLHGSQFLPGGTVTFEGGKQALNVQTTASTPMPSSAFSSSATINLAFHSQQAAQTVVVQSNGTFDVIIHIPQDWQVGTNHDIRADEQASNKSAYGIVTVTVQASSITPTPTPSPSKPTSQPSSSNTQPAGSSQNQPASQSQSPSQGQGSSHLLPTFPEHSQDNPPQNNPSHGNSPGHASTPVCLGVDKTQMTFKTDAPEHAPDAQVVTINNDSECDAGKWSAQSDVPWLRAEASQSSIGAGDSLQVKLSVSTDDFKDGINTTGHITFEPGDATVLVRLIVAPSTPCIIQVTDSLQFTLTNGDNISSSPESQQALIGNGANCGAGQWTVSSDQPWLVAQGGGQIDPGEIVGARVSIDSNALSSQGDQSFEQYVRRISGTVIFKTGSSSVTVHVKLLPAHTNALTPCISPSTDSIDFTGDLKNNSYYDTSSQAIKITNCGDPGTVTATVTQQGVSWLSANGGGPLDPSGNLLIIARAIHPDSDGSPLLQGKDYHGLVTITITTSDGHTKDVRVNVTYHLKDTRPKLSTCLTASATTLSFTLRQDGSITPGPQTISIINGATCAAGTWAATSDSPNWLNVTGGGQIATGGTGSATISAHVPPSISSVHDTIGLIPYQWQASGPPPSPTPLNGTITIKVGDTTQAVVKVVLSFEAQTDTTTPTVAPAVCPTVNASTFTFNAVQGGAAPGSQPLTLSNGKGCNAGNWSAKSDAAWLSISSGGGTLAVNGSTSLNINTSIADLAPGSHTGHISFSPGQAVVTVTLNIAPSVTPTPHVTITVPPPVTATVPPPATATVAPPVTATVPPPATATVASPAATCLTPSSRAISVTLKLGTQTTQYAAVKNGGSCAPGQWTSEGDSSWISAGGSGQIAASGSASVEVNITTNGLIPGKTYQGNVIFTSGSSKALIPVSLTIDPLEVTPEPIKTPVVQPTQVQPTQVQVQPTKVIPPALPVLKQCITAVPGALYFPITAQAGDPGNQVVTLSNCGSTGTITLRTTGGWLSATGGGPIVAGANTAITVHVTNINQAGTYSGTITAIITTADGKVASTTISVTLKVNANQPPPQPTQPPVVPTQPAIVPTQPTNNQGTQSQGTPSQG